MVGIATRKRHLELGNACPFANDRELGGQGRSKATRTATQSEWKHYGKGRSRRVGVQKHGVPFADACIEGEKVGPDGIRLLMWQLHDQINLTVSH
jgi:hypothetical protein